MRLMIVYIACNLSFMWLFCRFKAISRICCKTVRSLLQLHYIHKRFCSVEENLPSYLMFLSQHLFAFILPKPQSYISVLSFSCLINSRALNICLLCLQSYCNFILLLSFISCFPSVCVPLSICYLLVCGACI